MTTSVLTEPTPTQVRDPICGMEFNPSGAAAWRILDGETYYFCAERCAREFDRRHPGALVVLPAARLKQESAEPLTTVSSPAPAEAAALPGWLMPALAVVAVAAVLAVGVFGVSPGNLFIYAMVLACPLMHVFMMRGMGHGGHAGPDAAAPNAGRDGANDRTGGRACH